MKDGIFSRNKKGLLFYLEHDFLCHFDGEQIEKKIAFFDQNKGKRLIIDNDNFGTLLSKMLFCNQDHYQTLILVVFSGGINKEK